MNKFAICLSKKDTKILQTFDTKEEAMEAGKLKSKITTREEGLISVISGDFDENDQLTQNKYLIWETFLY